MADKLLCPDCGRERSESGCHGWMDCMSYMRDRIRALESELASARTAIADLSYQLGKAQGEAEGHRLVRVGLEAELAEMRKREEDVRTLFSLKQDEEVIVRRGLNDEILVYFAPPDTDRNDAENISWCTWDVPSALAKGAEWVRARSPRPEPERRNEEK